MQSNLSTNHNQADISNTELTINVMLRIDIDSLGYKLLDSINISKASSLSEFLL